MVTHVSLIVYEQIRYLWIQFIQKTAKEKIYRIIIPTFSRLFVQDFRALLRMDRSSSSPAIRIPFIREFSARTSERTFDCGHIKNRHSVGNAVPQTVEKLSVIANQSADWCGDPLTFREICVF